MRRKGGDGVKHVRMTSLGLIVSGLVSAPCFVGIALIPVGLGAVMSSALFTFLDTYRYIFMAVTVGLLVVAHVGLRRAEVFRPTWLVWGATVVAAVFILGELAIDPPWGEPSALAESLRHAVAEARHN
jgi:hypothetical protein